MRKKILLWSLVAAMFPLGMVAAAYATPPAGGPPGQGECSHGNSGKDCKPDPQPGHGKDCEEHGNYGGVNEDHCLPEETTPTDTTPTTPTDTTPTTPTTPVVPPSHNCTYTGAGKDGQPGNDDCAPITTAPTATTPAAAPTVTVAAAPPTQTVTNTVTVQAPPKVVTKVVVKTKTRVIVSHKTRVIRKTVVKRVKVCPSGTRMYKGTCHAIVMGSG